MGNFVQVNNTLVNLDRLLAVQHNSEVSGGVIYSPEHYLAVFDTKQEIRLSVEDGKKLIDYSTRHLRSRPVDGNMPTTSDFAT